MYNKALAALAMITLLIVIVLVRYESAMRQQDLRQQVKAHQEANAILEQQLDHMRMSDGECKAVLEHTIKEGIRLTELIVKNNKGKK